MARTETPETAGGQLYQAVWRWHFYAGLIVMPVLMLMALTGGLYLYKAEINAAVHAPLASVPVRAAATTPQAWLDAAQDRLGGQPIRLEPPARPGEAARVTLDDAGGRRIAFIDPFDARVTGWTPFTGVTETVKKLHSLELVAPWANLLIEVVAGWAIVLAATGLFLWWPRGRGGGVVSVRGSPSRRVFWRDLHAVTGVAAAGVILFLAATGMPWSAVWGQEVRRLTNEAGLGRPPPPAAGEAWTHRPSHDPAPLTPWALQDSDLAAPTVAAPSVDSVVRAVEAVGLPRPYALSIPTQPGKAWAATHAPGKVEATRTLYLDGTGKLLADIGYGDFGPAARTIEWGIAVHQGQQFGEVNRVIMLTGCIAVWLLGLSALVMWWKRRPSGRLAAPPAPSGPRAYAALICIVLPLAIVFPLTGASVIIALILDLGVRRLRATTPSLAKA